MIENPPTTICICGQEYPVDSLTFEQLRCQYGTGRAVISGTGRDRTTSYQIGCMTALGDIEKEEWMRIVHLLIEHRGESRLFESLLAWTKANCAWLRSPKEQEFYALELHADRIFSNPQWSGMEEFAKYQKEV